MKTGDQRTASQLSLDIRLRDDATFENYIGAVPAGLSGADRFVCLWGNHGTGKSHLLQALCHQARQENHGVIYIQDLKRHSPEILRSLETFHLVCLDDADHIIGRESWEIALFHLINAVLDGHSRLVVSLTSSPASPDYALPDLGSRMRAAMAVRLEPLDDEQKMILLKRRASLRGFGIGEDVARYILARAPRDMHSLIAMLEILETETLRQQRQVTIPFARKILKL